MQVFQLPKQGRIFNYILLTSLLLVAAILGCAPLINAASGMATIFCLGISAISIVFVLSGLNETSAKLILDAEGITKVSFLGKQRILFKEMLGFRSSLKYLYIYSSEDSGEVMYIPERISETGKVEMQLRQHCPLVTDEIWMMEELYPQLYSSAKARIWAYILTGLTILLVVLVFIYGALFPWLLIALFLCLPATILFLARFRRASLISGHGRAEQIVFAIPVFVFMALMMCNKDYFLLDSTPVRTWALAIMFVLVLLQLCTFREHRKRIVYFFMMTAVNVILYFGCGYVMVEAANNLLDKSRPRTHCVVITDKHTEKKTKFTGYYFKLACEENQPEEIAVPKSLYYRRQVDDTVYLLCGEGALGMPWYKLLPQ